MSTYSNLSVNGPPEISEDGKYCKKCCCCKFIPDWFLKETRAILSLAWPLIVTTEMMFGISTMALIFAGHVGQEELAGISLALSLLNVASNSLGSGATTACDTYFSQTYGSDNKKMVGIHVQRAVMIIFLICFPVWSFLINAEYFLLLLGQDPCVSRISGTFLLVFAPGILSNFMFRLSTKYLANQNDVIPLVCLSTCAVGLSIGVNYYLVDQLELKVMGVAIAAFLGYTILLLLTLAYIKFSGMYKHTWGGFSKESFKDWGAFTKLGIYGTLMTLLEWMSFEIGTILAGTLELKDLTAFSIVFQLETMINIVHLGTSVACGVRLGQELGKGDFEAAKKVSKASLVISFFTSTIICILVGALNKYIPLLFTKDTKVVTLVSENLLVIIAYIFLSGTAFAHSGLLRGSGRQKEGALGIFIGFYCCGLPVGIPIMLLTYLKLSGYLVGLIIGQGVVSIILVTMVWKTNWKKQCKLAQERAGLKKYSKKKRTGYNETNIDEHYHDAEKKISGESTKLIELSGDSLKTLTISSNHMLEPVTSGLMLKRLFTFLFLICLLGASILFKIYAPLPKINVSANATRVCFNGTTMPFSYHDY